MRSRLSSALSGLLLVSIDMRTDHLPPYPIYHLFLRGASFCEHGSIFSESTQGEKKAKRADELKIFVATST